MSWSVPKSLLRTATEVEGWLELDCPERALEKMVPLLETPGARPVGLYFQATALIRLKRHEEALDALIEVRQFELDEEWLDLSEAWCKKRMDDIPGAVQCMHRLIKRCPKSAIGHFNLGCYLALQGKKEPALEEIAVACGLDGEFRKIAADEEDLDSLKGDKRFDDLLPPKS